MDLGLEPESARQLREALGRGPLLAGRARHRDERRRVARERLAVDRLQGGALAVVHGRAQPSACRVARSPPGGEDSAHGRERDHAATADRRSGRDGGALRTRRGPRPRRQAPTAARGRGRRGRRLLRAWPRRARWSAPATPWSCSRRATAWAVARSTSPSAAATSARWAASTSGPPRTGSWPWPGPWASRPSRPTTPAPTSSSTRDSARSTTRRWAYPTIRRSSRPVAKLVGLDDAREATSRSRRPGRRSGRAEWDRQTFGAVDRRQHPLREGAGGRWCRRSRRCGAPRRRACRCSTCSGTSRRPGNAKTRGQFRSA